MPSFIHNAVSIHYEAAGSGTPLLLLPGNTSSSAMHEDDISFFSTRFHVICPDYPGYGRSDRVGELPVDFWWQNALLCIRLVESLGVSSFVCIGVSGGALVALSVAVVARERVTAVVADSFAGEFITPEWADFIISGRARMTHGMCDFLRTAHGDDFARVVEADSRMLARAAALGESLVKDSLSRIVCPVLITGSLSDQLVPDVTGMCDVARKIPSSKVVFYPDGAHPLMWSRPDDFRAEAIAFLTA